MEPTPSSRDASRTPVSGVVQQLTQRLKEKTMQPDGDYVRLEPDYGTVE